jgi:hypothetical protein
MPTFSFQSAFNSRDDLKNYGDNALILFALELRWSLEDIDAVAIDALTDGPDDKKADLVYVDVDSGIAVIAQGYSARTPQKEAPANKAADLNTAIAWLLSRDIDELPNRLRPGATVLRRGLESGEIETIEIWYVHNCLESTNVANELASVEANLKNAIATRYANSNHSEIKAIEVGLNTLDQWYSSMSAPILVGDEFTVSIPGGYEISTDSWRAFATAVPAKWIFELYQKYEKTLFSANLRDYLGSRRSDSNINQGIKDSASYQPNNFWVFNNGITTLVNSFTASADNRTIRISGISIVNGAQTTGAVGSLDNPPNEDAYIPARFVECNEPKVIQAIVRYNNSQNKVAAADFRSTDAIQDRLRNEFTQRYPGISYLGGRRGGTEDIIPRRGQNYIPSDTIAQALTAFHHDPVLAYNRKSRIWESDLNYSRVFNDNTHADHLIFVYALLRSISSLKLSLSANTSDLIDADRDLLKFLELRGAIYVFISALGDCMEIITHRPISSKFLLRFASTPDLTTAEQYWSPIVKTCVSFNQELQVPLLNGLNSADETQKAIERFKPFINSVSTSSALQADFGDFANKVSLAPWPARVGKS